MTDVLTPAKTQSLVIERDLAHPPAKVWRALTQPALIAEWLMSNDFAPVVGHSFKLRTEPSEHWNGLVDCQVLEVEAERRLVYTWESSGEARANGMRTVLAYDLVPTATGTHLRIEQSGFRPVEDAGFMRGAEYGWNRMVGTLAEVVDRIA